MKMCFLVYGLGCGGAERTIAYLSNYAVAHNVDVDIVMYGQEKSCYELDKHVNICQLESYKKTSKTSKFVKLVNSFRNYLNIRKEFKLYIKENKPDVVFCMLSDSILYAFKGCKKTPIIGSERSNPYWMTSKIQKLKRKFVFNKTSGIIFQTERAKNFYDGKIKVPNVAIIPNAVGNELVYKLDYNPKIFEKKIGAVGSLRAQKDYPTMIKAFAIFLKNHPDYVLEIFGEGSDKQKLIDLTKELNIENSVKFMGVHSDALKQISNSACYVLSSISEGMPNALMEAMAIGVPCISTDCNNGPAELIENNVNGILVPIQDIDKLSDAMTKMVDDRKFANSCGENAKKLRETNSIEVIAKRYFDFVEQVVKEGKK